MFAQVTTVALTDRHRVLGKNSYPVSDSIQNGRTFFRTTLLWEWTNSGEVGGLLQAQLWSFKTLALWRISRTSVSLALALAFFFYPRYSVWGCFFSLQQTRIFVSVMGIATNRSCQSTNHRSFCDSHLLSLTFSIPPTVHKSGAGKLTIKVHQLRTFFPFQMDAYFSTRKVITPPWWAWRWMCDTDWNWRISSSEATSEGSVHV